MKDSIKKQCKLSELELKLSSHVIFETKNQEMGQEMNYRLQQRLG